MITSAYGTGPGQALFDPRDKRIADLETALRSLADHVLSGEATVESVTAAVASARATLDRKQNGMKP